MKKVKSLKNIIENEVKNSKDLKKELLKSNWEEIVGNALAKRSEIMYIRKETAYLRVENSAWLQQMQFLKKDIIKKINEYLNGVFIKSIFFKIGKKTYRKAFVDFQEGLNSIDLDTINLESEDIYEIKNSLQKISDPEYKKKIYNLMIKNRKREIYLLKKGHKRCEKCGALFNLESEHCTVCEMKIKKDRERIMYALISRKPIIEYIEMKSIIKDLSKKEFEIANKKYIDKKLNQIYILKREKKEFELKKTVAEYLMVKDKSKSNILQRTELFIQSFT